MYFNRYFFVETENSKHLLHMIQLPINFFLTHEKHFD